MSRVGNRVLVVPAGVTVDISASNFVSVTGKLGKLERAFSPKVKIILQDNTLTTQRLNEEKATKQLHGTTNALLANMLKGVSEGFQIDLEIKGVGYKAELKGNKLVVAAGYSHLVTLDVPSNVEVKVPKPVEISVKGIDKQAVGAFAAVVREIRKPNPYSGKGISYKGEKIRRKEGKTASK